MIKAEIISDSINMFGNRITTFILDFPRIVLSEFNTHRMLSRNSASSRAIPFEKMAEMVMNKPFIPIRWMKDHKGMQGTEYINGFAEIDIHDHWLEARDLAVKKAKSLHERGLTKQICNRLLEPFMWHKVIATGTEWQNFFALRAHPDAEIHIQELAHKMLEVYNNNTPKELAPGEWHIPFGDKIDYHKVYNIVSNNGSISFFTEHIEEMEKIKVKIATARCARISYLNFEGKDDYDADVKLYDRLLKSGHMSPFEHCAKAMDKEMGAYTWSGNFKGFIQYRKMIDGENKIDERVKLW